MHVNLINVCLLIIKHKIIQFRKMFTISIKTKYTQTDDTNSDY